MNSGVSLHSPRINLSASNFRRAATFGTTPQSSVAGVQSIQGPREILSRADPQDLTSNSKPATAQGRSPYIATSSSAPNRTAVTPSRSPFISTQNVRPRDSPRTRRTIPNENTTQSPPSQTRRGAEITARVNNQEATLYASSAESSPDRRATPRESMHLQEQPSDDTPRRAPPRARPPSAERATGPERCSVMA